jgi:hypothetical protein
MPTMMDVHFKGLEWTRERVAAAADQTQAWGTRLATWLVLGNTAAVVTALSAARYGLGADVGGLARPFIWGLTLAFAGAVLSYFAGLVSIKPLSSSADALSTVLANTAALEALDEEFPDRQSSPDDPLERGITDAADTIADLPKRLRPVFLLSGAALLLYAASAGLFLWGAHHASVELAQIPPVAPGAAAGSAVQ